MEKLFLLNNIKFNFMGNISRREQFQLYLRMEIFTLYSEVSLFGKSKVFLSRIFHSLQTENGIFPPVPSKFSDKHFIMIKIYKFILLLLFFQTILKINAN
jgi:hypothetical protein